MLAVNFVSNLMAKGRYTFTVAQAAEALGQSLVATRADGTLLIH